LTFQIRQNYPALVGFLPEPDFCRIWKKFRIPAGAGAKIRYSPNSNSVVDYGQHKWLNVADLWSVLPYPSYDPGTVQMIYMLACLAQRPYEEFSSIVTV